MIQEFEYILFKFLSVCLQMLEEITQKALELWSTGAMVHPQQPLKPK